MTTVDQLRAAALAATEALAQAERDAAAAAEAAAAEERRLADIAVREAKRNAPEPASYGERRAHLNAIAKHLLALFAESTDLKDHATAMVTAQVKTVKESDAGPLVSWASPELVMTLRGVQIYGRVEFKAEQTGGGRFYASRSNGKLRMAVGDWGDTTSFPQKKDGTFNYEAAASKLFAKVMSAESAYKAAVTVKGNEADRDALRKEFGLTNYSDVVCTKKFVRNHGSRDGYEVVAPAGMVLLQLTKTVTPEQARAILAAAVAAGVVL